MFRRLAATLNFMSTDRSDVQHEGNMHQHGDHPLSPPPPPSPPPSSPHTRKLDDTQNDWGLATARRFAARQGLGCVWYFQTRCLWVQERVRHGHVTILQVRGKNNPADMFTKDSEWCTSCQVIVNVGVPTSKSVCGAKRFAWKSKRCTVDPAALPSHR